MAALLPPGAASVSCIEVLCVCVCVVCVYTCVVCVCVCLLMFGCICVCIYICIYVYVHTGLMLGWCATCVPSGIRVPNVFLVAYVYIYA